MKNKIILLTKNHKQLIVTLIVVYSISLAILFFLERDFLLRSSVIDDLNLVKTYCSRSLLDVLLNHGYKYRPVSGVAIWLISNICKGNLYLYGYINLLLAALCSTLIYYCIKKNINSDFLAILASLIYIFSRFSYYQISTQMGVMETTSTLFGIFFIWYLYKYMAESTSKYYYFAMIFYVLCCFSHERYAVLMPVLLYAWFITEKNQGYIFAKKNLSHYKKPLFTLCVFFLIMLIFKIMVSNVMMGTGGVPVTSETFSIQSLFTNVKMSIAYLFTINSSEAYLSMVGWSEYAIEIKVIVILSIIMIFSIVIISIYEMTKLEKEERKKKLSIVGMFVLGAGAMIFISSVTIRVELRWMYYPYMLAVFMLVYLTQIRIDKRLLIAKHSCLCIYVIVMILFGVYCRDGFYSRLYYMWDYTIANELSDDTYGVYGEDMYSKSWVLVVPFELHYSYYDLLDQFDAYDKYDLKLEVVFSPNDLININSLENKEVLYYDESKGDFINISSMIQVYTGQKTGSEN